MALHRAFLLTIVGFVAIQLISAAAVPTREDNVAVAMRNAKFFSLEGILECLGVGGFVGLNEIFQEIQTDCIPLGEGFRYRLCAIGKLAKLGPMYLKCIAEN